MIDVNWFRDGQPLQEGVCHSVSVMGANGLHSIWSVLRVMPRREDEGSMFTCRVTHAALRDSVERSYTLQLPSKSCTLCVFVNTVPGQQRLA